MPQFDTSRILRESFVREVEYLPVVDSTNTRAADRAKSGKAKLPLLVLADRQTAGRGRGTNRWWTGEESLAFSLLVDESFLPQANTRFPLIGTAAGFAVISVMQWYLTHHHVRLYWPNNIFVADRKLGGILVEMSGGRYATIGIGINGNTSMQNAPVELQPLAVSMLNLIGKQVDLTEVLCKILGALECELQQLRSLELIEKTPPYCLPQDQPVTVRYEEGIIQGICRGIEADRSLILETSDGMKSIRAWTVES